MNGVRPPGEERGGPEPDKNEPDENEPDAEARKTPHPRVMTRAADAFLLSAAAVYGFAALAMAAVSFGLIAVSVIRIHAALTALDASETALLDAVSSLVISVAILDVAKYVMEEEVLRSRELREARQAVTRFMVIIALVVSIEAIVLVFEHGKSDPTLLLYPILLLFASVVIVIGLGLFQSMSLKAEKTVDPGELRG